MQDHKNREREKEQQMNKNVQRMVVSPVRIVSIVLKFLDQRHRNFLALLVVHSISGVFVVRGKHFITVNSHCYKHRDNQNYQGLNLNVFFYDIFLNY